MRLTIVLSVLASLMLAPSAAHAWTREAAVAIATARFDNALRTVYKFAFGCLTTRAECPLDRRQELALDRIYKEMLFARPRLEFASEAAQPGFFQLDGAVRIAKTGSRRGDVIYVNTDLVAVPADDPADGFRPLSFDEAIAILIHELGHHNDPTDGPRHSHEELDVLGGLVRAQMLRHADVEVIDSSRWSAVPAGQTVSLEHYVSLGNQSQGQEISHLFLTTPAGVSDLSGLVKGRATCPRAYYRDELDFEGSPFAFFIETYTLGFDATARDRAAFALDVTKATVLCLNELPGRQEFDHFPGYKNGRLRVTLTVDAEGRPVYDPTAVLFQMTTPADRHWY